MLGRLAERRRMGKDAPPDLVGWSKKMRDKNSSVVVELEALQEERARILLDHIEDYAIFMLDTSGHVKSWNVGAERINGYTPGEILGRHFSLFYRPADIVAGGCERELRIATAQGRFEEEGWRIRKTGEQYWASVILTAVRDATGKLLGFAKVTRDLTERRKAEEQLLRLVQAQEALRLRDEFLSIAAHELKTPLTALQLQLQGLKKHLVSLEPKDAARLDRALGSTGRLSELIETLLDVSRLSTGRLALQPERFELVTTVKDVVERLQEAAARASCPVRVQAVEPLEGRWDRLRTEQVVIHLLSNAFKYAAGGPVELSLAREGTEALLVITDSGPGLPEAALPRLFGRFERAAPVSHYGGLGLGLYVCREIVEGHGGSISAENAPGGGARFTVRLPLDASEPG